MSEQHRRDPDLDAQLSEIRQEAAVSDLVPTVGQGVAPWKAAAYLLVMVLAVGGAFVLLASNGLRGQVVRLLAGSFQAYMDPGQEIFPMPAPRPTGGETIVIGGGGVASGGDPIAGEEMIYEPEELGQTDPAGGAAEEFVPASRSADMQAAYQYLADNSELVGRLTRGEVEGYEFKEWNPRVNRAPVFLIDLVVVRDGEEVTFVYQVDTSRERVRPVNQEARDFERAN